MTDFAPDLNAFMKVSTHLNLTILKGMAHPQTKPEKARTNAR